MKCLIWDVLLSRDQPETRSSKPSKALKRIFEKEVYVLKVIDV